MYAFDGHGGSSASPFLVDTKEYEYSAYGIHQTILPYAATALADHQELIAYTYEQGKVAELRAELTNPTKKDKNHASKKNALKKIVANMTMSNNDMVALFPDIVACMEIPVLEIKKMYVKMLIMLICS